MYITVYKCPSAIKKNQIAILEAAKSRMCTSCMTWAAYAHASNCLPALPPPPTARDRQRQRQRGSNKSNHGNPQNWEVCILPTTYTHEETELDAMTVWQNNISAHIKTSNTYRSLSRGVFYEIQKHGLCTRQNPLYTHMYICMIIINW